MGLHAGPLDTPWSYVRVLSDALSEREAAVVDMREAFELFTRLEASRHPMAKALLEKMPFRSWPVVREVLENVHDDAWNPNCEFGREYVRECSSDCAHTLMEEECFNSLRDNEQRKAKHKQRGEHALSALALSSAHTKYPDVRQVSVTPEDVSAYRAVKVKASTFHPEGLAKKGVDHGVTPSSITGKTTWNAFTFDFLAGDGCPLFRALLRTDEEEWASLWYVGLVPRHVILGHAESGRLFYVVATSPWLLFAWDLEDGPDGLRFHISGDALRERTITSLTDYIVYTFAYSLKMTHDSTDVWFHLQVPYTILGFACQHTLHKLPMTSLKKLREVKGLPKPQASTIAGHVRCIVEGLGYGDTEGGRWVMQQADSAYARRVAQREKKKAEKKATTQGPDGSSSSSEEEEEDVGEEETVEPAQTKALALLRDIAPREMRFVMGDTTACAGGLNEEEDDPILEMDARGASSGKGRGGGVDRGRGRRAGGRDPAARGRGRRQAAPSSSTSSDSSTSSESEEPPALGGTVTPPAQTLPDDPPVEDPVPAVDVPRDEALVEPREREIDGAAVRAQAARAFPTSGEPLVAPARCTFTHYPINSEYKAVLPPGCTFEGTHTKSRRYGALRSEPIARAEVQAWLSRAVQTEWYRRLVNA